MVAIKSLLSIGAAAFFIDAVSAQTFQRLGTCPKLGEYRVGQLICPIGVLMLRRMHLSS